MESVNSGFWPEPEPINTFRKDLSPVIPLPLGLLPLAYQSWLQDVSERMQCPLEYVAIGSIIVTASLIGTGCSIRPKAYDSWTVIPNLWGGIIGSPGTLKSPALKEVLRPLEILEEKARAHHAVEQEAVSLELEVIKATKEALKKEMIKAIGLDDSAALAKAKERLRTLKEPRPTACKRYSTNDATIEKMHELLSQNPRGLLLFRDELMGLLTSGEKEGHEGDRTFYLEAWNGYGSKTTDRIGRGTIHTKNLCVSLLGTTQPNKLLFFGRDLSGAQTDGLLPRFQLLVYPDESPSWTLVDRPPDLGAGEQALAVMTRLADMDFTQKGLRLGPSGTAYVQFDPEAQDLFYAWLKDLEFHLRLGDENPLMTESLAKHRKLLPSLALIFHLIDSACSQTIGPIPCATLNRAIQWCAILKSHAEWIYALSERAST